MDAWLQGAIDRLAAVDGAEPTDYMLYEAEIQTLLDLARVAAHESGERTNAPLLCYLIGLAAARSDADVDTLADAVTRD